MTTLQFADTYNLVAFLSKPAESEGFEQIMYFLNANPIRYALTINPIIYTSCIEQFWATVKAKTINEEVQLQALADGKNVIITESTVKRDLHLEDAKCIDCLPNATIFEQLTFIRYEKVSQKLTFYKEFFSPQWKFLIHTILQWLSAKTTAWNEFSSPMASAIICLATNQKFNFSKYIFESMVKNLENVSGKFLMYPRFVQVFLEKQLEGMSNHKRIYVTPSYTKKIFGNIKRVGKGFSRSVTPLFPTMMVQAQEEMGEDNVVDEAVNEEMDNNLERAATTATSLDAEQDMGIQDLFKWDQQVVSELTLIDETQGRYGDDLMFDTGVLDKEAVFAGQDMDEKEINVAETEVSTADPVTTTSEVVTITIDDLTLAQTLIEIKRAKSKVKGVMIGE
ncbi:hypothetical protein Tco_0770118 [Tanacetum coccineum]|uniref:Xylulose kinase-1 n=1 Tax=Tanacetum coccineum TaxID=301880 RepID=A0ABQ4ZCA2_9ASTR